MLVHPVDLSETRRSEEHAGGDVTQDRGLTDPPRQRAEDQRGRDEDGDLRRQEGDVVSGER
jgi:hypothetical protein